MPSAQYQLQLHLLLTIALLVAGQIAPVLVPPKDLQTPNFDQQGESFERFESKENSAEMREQLKQLLGDQLANAFAPLATTPFSNLAQRQPGIVAPTSGEEARSQFSDESDSNEAAEEQEEEEEEEESPEEEDGSSEEEPASQPTPQPQLPPQPLPPPVSQVDQVGEGQVEDYNAWRDNFYDLEEDGSYVFGYAIPHGVRRWEKGFYFEDHHGRVVEGFYVQPRHVALGLRYELRCYRADSEGYHPLPVEFLQSPPNVRRGEDPQVDCFKTFDGRRAIV
ncbi:hypothetical protein KR009_011054 [Drosophila setifemur]|nr:hypothetical protein KR009_011054 [Drosophila setifemur]